MCSLRMEKGRERGESGGERMTMHMCRSINSTQQGDRRPECLCLSYPYRNQERREEEKEGKS